MFYFITQALVTIVKLKAQLSIGWADQTSYIRRPASDCRSQKENFHRVSRPTVLCTLWWCCYIERCSQR